MLLKYLYHIQETFIGADKEFAHAKIFIAIQYLLT